MKKNNYPIGVPNNIPDVRVPPSLVGKISQEELDIILTEFRKEGYLNTPDRLKQIIDNGLPDSIQELLNE